MNNQNVNWPGKSGVYTFEVLKMDGNWNVIPGIYIFAKEVSLGAWKALYVGEAVSFKNRLTVSHEKWSSAVLMGATHVHALIVQGSEIERKRIESDLILALDPPLNRKLSVDLHTLLST